jgi:hypothetical protein
MGQAAPATAQVWDVRFDVDSSGPFAAGPLATAVGITIRARVGIRSDDNGTVAPNWSTNNFGVSRVGGASGTFFITAVDPLGGPDRGRFAQGFTGETDGGGNPLLDTGGIPLAGHFSPFRGSFAPGAPTFGSNADLSNGTVQNSNTNADPRITGLVGSRAFGYDGLPRGAAATASDANPANLVGDYAAIYRFIYFPRPEFGPPSVAIRNITINVTGLSVRYLSAVSGSNATAAAAVSLPSQSFTFQVPTPGATALVGLAGLAAFRRRRA